MADGIDIPKLTHELEQGQGCALKAELDKMPFEDVIKTMKQIESQNQVDRHADSSIREIDFYSNGDGYHAYAELYDPGAHWYNFRSILIKETLAIDTDEFSDTTPSAAGDRASTCQDVK